MKTAIYARYSTDKQSDSSTADQFRNCEAAANREGWVIVRRYSDEGISGSVSNRPGYQKLLNEADKGIYECLIIEDLSRLSRDDIEMKRTLRRLSILGVRVIGISDGYDSAQKGHKIHASMRGMLNEIYIDDVREKTKRGMTGKALKGCNTGGSCFGYKAVPILDSVHKDEYGRPLIIEVRREIEPREAETVIKIFEMFAAGYSCRWICGQLNQQKIPSPRGGTWCASAIHGVQEKHTGMLNNQIYIGKLFWNKRKFTKDTETGKRIAVMNPKEEWILSEVPELQIVSNELWQKVKDRQRLTYNRIDQKTQKAKRGAPPHKYLFSGLLKCAKCGHNYVLVGSGGKYGCSAHRDRGTAVCENNITVSRKIVEERLLEGIKNSVMHPAALEQFIEEANSALKANRENLQPDMQRAGESLKLAEREIENLLSILKTGFISDSIKAELSKAEVEKRRLIAIINESEAELSKIEAFLPRAADRFKNLVQNFEKMVYSEIPRAREILKGILGDSIQLHNFGHGYLEAEIKGNFASLLNPESRIEMVAGACNHYKSFRIPMVCNTHIAYRNYITSVKDSVPKWIRTKQ